MSSTSSPASAASASDSNEPECGRLPSVSASPTREQLSLDIGRECPSSTTCAPSQPRLFPTPTVGAASMSLQAVSPVRTSATRASAPGLRASAADYGQSSPELLAKYDPATSSWRTSQLCLDGELSEFSETWPRSGLMRNGIAYRLPPLVPHTAEIGSGLWPTPTEDGNYNKKGLSERSGDGLATAVAKWPTPTARDWKDGSAKACANVPVNGLLGRAIHTPRTTPRSARELDGVSPLGNGGLNPTWVEWLMGFPLGWTALDASATPSSRKSRKSLAKRSSKQRPRDE